MKNALLRSVASMAGAIVAFAGSNAGAAPVTAQSEGVIRSVNSNTGTNYAPGDAIVGDVATVRFHTASRCAG